MKNIKLKIKNEGDDGKEGSEEAPMLAGGLAGPAQCGVRNAECGMNREGDPLRQGEEAEFEDWRLKTDFREKHRVENGDRHLSPALSPIEAERVNVAGAQGGGECVLASVQSRVGLAGEGEESRTTTRTKGRRDEGMVIGALCLFVPPNRYGCLGSPGKSAVAGDLAGAVHDAVVNLEMWARFFCAMRFLTAVVGTGSNVCRAASRVRAFGISVTDFQLFPLISTWFRSFDNKNNFWSGNPVRSAVRHFGGYDSEDAGPTRLNSLKLA